MRNSLTLPSEEVDRLIAEGQQYVVRFKVEAGREILVNDLIRGEVRVKTWYDPTGSGTNHYANVYWQGNGGQVAASRYQQYAPQSRRNLFFSAQDGLYARSYADYTDFSNTQTWTIGESFLDNNNNAGPAVAQMYLWESSEMSGVSDIRSSASVSGVPDGFKLAKAGIFYDLSAVFRVQTEASAVISTQNLTRTWEADIPLIDDDADMPKRIGPYIYPEDGDYAIYHQATSLVAQKVQDEPVYLRYDHYE